MLKTAKHFLHLEEARFKTLAHLVDIDCNYCESVERIHCNSPVFRSWEARIQALALGRSTQFTSRPQIELSYFRHAPPGGSEDQEKCLESF